MRPSRFQVQGCKVQLPVAQPMQIGLAGAWSDLAAVTGWPRDAVHTTPGDAVLLRISYAWNPDNTVASRSEYDAAGAEVHTAEVAFGYDAGKRLIWEQRVEDQIMPPVYDLAYEYDQLGNRTVKHDYVNDRITDYVYDTDYEYPPDPNDPNAPALAYWTRNNRLLEYKVYGPDAGQGRPLERTVKYTYYDNGHVAHITIKDEYNGQGQVPLEYEKYYDLNLVYGTNETLWLAIWQHWEAEPPPEWADEVTDVWEFRQDTGRQRYMARQWDTPSVYPGDWTVAGTTWTDYLGQQPYVDYEVDFDPNEYPVPYEETRYLAGFGVQAEQAMDDPNTPRRYLHGDLIRSTMLLTDESGEPCGTGLQPVMVYTAFGEPVRDPDLLDTRYQYAGGYGYESGLITLYGANPELPPITLQHVGARWYQPSIGRFVQRDPIGITGGMNVYLYCGANPLSRVDPMGLWSWRGFIGGLIAGAGMGALGGSAFGGVAGIVGGIGGGIVGGIVGGMQDDGFAEGVKYGGGLGGAAGTCIAAGLGLLGPPAPKPSRPETIPLGPVIPPDGPIPPHVWPGDDHVVPSTPPDDDLPELPRPGWDWWDDPINYVWHFRSSEALRLTVS